MRLKMLSMSFMLISALALVEADQCNTTLKLQSLPTQDGNVTCADGKLSPVEKRNCDRLG